MTATNAGHTLTAALEDYLETIYELVRDRGVARVRDIAKARSVKAGSVSPALRRLSELGLVRYEQREFIALTEDGAVSARRIFARHQVLERFFEELLGLPREVATQDACSMEHHLSDEAMDRMVRFFEYLWACPNAGHAFISNFHSCARLNLTSEECEPSCPNRTSRAPRGNEEANTMSLAELKPGQAGIIQQVNAQGAVRQRLLDMGMLPNVVVQVERVALSGDPIWVKLGGYQLSLRRREAQAITLTRTNAL